MQVYMLDVRIDPPFKGVEIIALQYPFVLEAL